MHLQVLGRVCVDHAQRGLDVVDYTADALREVAGTVVTLAQAEDLPAHGAAVTVRFHDGDATQDAP